MSYSENEDDPPVYESSGDEWDESFELERKRNKRRTSQRLSKKPRITRVETTSDSESDDDDEEDDDVVIVKKPMNGVNNKIKASPSKPTVAIKADTQVSVPPVKHEPATHNFSTGTFVISKKDAQQCSVSSPPCIWKVDGKALLQKYEPFEDEGKVKHRNTSIYTGWSSLDKDEYASIQVQVFVHSGQKMIVELNWDQLKTIEIDSD